MVMNTKECKKCGRSLQRTDFHKDSKTKDGRRPYCKLCVKKDDLQRNIKMREKFSSAAKGGKKRCISCGIIKPRATGFYRNSAAKDGRRNTCIACASHANKRRVPPIHYAEEFKRNNTEKSCSRCRAVKPLDQFSPREDVRTGYSSMCNDCNKVRHRKYYALNRAKESDRKANYYLTNREKVIAAITTYRENNPDKYRGFSALYRKRHRGVCVSHRAQRRAKEKLAIPLWFEKKAVTDLYRQAAEMRAAGDNVHVDHIIPLQNSQVCGLHCLANLQILSARENQKKGNRLEVTEW